MPGERRGHREHAPELAAGAGVGRDQALAQPRLRPWGMAEAAQPLLPGRRLVAGVIPGVVALPGLGRSTRHRAIVGNASVRVVPPVLGGWAM
ncbi:hypothetical protein F750_2996 [Streptomyces sp. PAMC 26508]|nr:hypothetical protein F750_2996 [Streptomyces sp. PAMC 26508]